MFSEKSDISEFEKLLSQYEYTFKRGDLVQGVIYGFDGKEGIFVDIGSKSTAYLPLSEAISEGENINDKYIPGTKYEFIIIDIREDNEQFILSRKKVELAYVWKELEKLKEDNETILAKVISIIKGGIIVDVSGVKGFVPSSQIKVKDTELQIGVKIKVKILTVDIKSNNFILSNKKVYDDDISQLKENLFNEIEIGQVVQGEVVRITDFGAFIDIGGLDGLLPLSQFSWKWVEHPTNMINVGDKINVQIIDIDKKLQRVSLSMKSLESDPWEFIAEHCSEGDKVDGIVTRIKPFGAFIELSYGVEALLPHNDLIAMQNNENKILQSGDKITAYISKFNPKDKRISLSVNNILPNNL